MKWFPLLLAALLLLRSGSAFSQETVGDLLATEHLTSKLDGKTKTVRLGWRSTLQYDEGTETYRFDNGKVALIYLETRDKTYILEQYNKAGDHLVKAGNGFYYQIETGNYDFPHRDSTVCQVTDRLKTGSYRRYRRYLNTPYYLTETGTLIDGQKTGVWQADETRLGIRSLTTYVNNEPDGYYCQEVRAENRAECGTMKGHRKSGLWTTTDTNKNKLEVAAYTGGYKEGLFISYHPNGKVAISGAWAQVDGEREYYVDNPDGSQRKEIEKVKNIEVKDGVWTYYDVQGGVVKTETYRKGKLL